MFSQYDMVQDNDDIPKVPSIYSINNFKHALKVRINIARNNTNLRPVIFRIRVTPEDDYNLIESVVINHIYTKHPNSIISYKNQTFYIMQAFTSKNIEELASEVLDFEYFEEQCPDYEFSGDFVELDLNMSTESLVKLL